SLLRSPAARRSSPYSARTLDPSRCAKGTRQRPHPPGLSRGVNMTTRVSTPSASWTLVCPASRQPLHREGDVLRTTGGSHSYPIVREIPRFVTGDRYARSFSFEWNVHDRTQLDRFRGDDSSEQMFRIKTGLKPDDVRGKLVLDAGVGAGRFADVLLRWGA